MALVGTITHDWNYLEHQLQVITWFQTRDPEAAHVFTARMKNAMLASALLELTEMREKRPRVKAAIKFLVSAFNILLENRNALVHSDHLIPITHTTARWSRKSKSKPREVITAVGDLADLQELANDIMKAQEYANGLMEYLEPEGWFFKDGKGRVFAGRPLPRRFRKPRKMLQPLPAGWHNDLFPPEA